MRKNLLKILLSNILILGAFFLFSNQVQASSLKNAIDNGLNFTNAPAQIQIDSNQTSKEFTSPILKSQFEFNSIVLFWNEQNVTSQNQTLSNRTLSIRTSVDGNNWGQWMDGGVSDDESKDLIDTKTYMDSPVFAIGSYYQYKFNLTRENVTALSPIISNVKVQYSDSRLTDAEKTSLQKIRNTAATSSVPKIISRAEWASPDPNGDLLKNNPSLYWPPSYSQVKQIFIHHTVTGVNNSDPAEVVRSIWNFHTHGREWGDIGYNYLVDQFGNIYEGKFGGDAVIGGHASGFNTGSVGISLIGCFQSNDSTCKQIAGPTVQPPNSNMLNGLTNLTSWVTTKYGIDPLATHQVCDYTGGDCHENLSTIAGHRDVGVTSCPGDLTYNILASIRSTTDTKNKQNLWAYSAQQQNLSYQYLSDFNDKTITLSFKNTGTATWSKTTNRILLKTANPSNRTSSFQGTGWIDSTTPALLNETTVAPGGIGTFTFKIKTPDGIPGKYYEYFKLISENNVDFTGYHGYTIYYSSGITSSINTPIEGTKYNASDIINFSGSASDTADGTLPASAFQWTVKSFDGNTEQIFYSINGVKSGSFTIPRTGYSDHWYKIYLVITDSAGNTTLKTRELLPYKSTVTVSTNVSNVFLKLDSANINSPYSYTTVVGSAHTLETSGIKSINGLNYVFRGWSDGDMSINKLIYQPNNDTLYSAQYDMTSWTVGNNINTANFNGAIYQAMRGSNGYSYTRVSSGGNSWSSWIQSGQTLSEVTMIVYNNKLFQSIRGTDGNSYTRYTNDGINWTIFARGGLSQSKVTMSIFNGRLYQAILGTDGNSYSRWTGNGDNWTTFARGGLSTSAVNMIVFNNKLYQAIRGTDGNNYTRSTSDGDNWSIFDKGNYTFGETNMVVFNNKLFQAIRGADGNSHIRFSSDGNSWSSFIGGGVALGNVTLGTIANKIVESIRGGDGNVYVRSSFDGISWNSWASSGGTITDINNFNFGVKLLQSMQGTDGKYYTRSTIDGNFWSAWSS